MNGEGPVFLQYLISLAGTIVGAYIIFYLTEVRKKQRIDTFWKIENEQKSEERQQSRKMLGEAIKSLTRKSEQFKNEGKTEEQRIKNLIEYYNMRWHESKEKSRRDKADKIRYLLKLQHEYGLLLRKGMIDKDMLYTIIGPSLEIDHEFLTIILQAHRDAHELPSMYNHVEYLYRKYRRWKRKSRFAKVINAAI